MTFCEFCNQDGFSLIKNHKYFAHGIGKRLKHWGSPKLPLLQREKAAIHFYRYTMKLSISHIAQILERSTRTVWKVLERCKNYRPRISKWRWSKMMKIRGESWFRSMKPRLQACLVEFLTYSSDDVEILSGEEPP